MNSIPEEIYAKVHAHGHHHVLAWWDQLDGGQRRKLIDQLRSIDFDELKALFAQKEQKSSLPDERRIAPLPRPEENPAERDRHLPVLRLRRRIVDGEALLTQRD